MVSAYMISTCIKNVWISLPHSMEKFPVHHFHFSLIVDGVCFSFGIFLLEFLDYFHENKGKTAWIGSVLNGTYMVMGK